MHTVMRSIAIFLQVAAYRDDWALDETGNRRFLPVKTTKINVAGLKRDRDAIWAAAYAQYQREPKWWLTEKHVLYAAQQTKLRQESDIWVELIQQKLSGMSEVSIKEAFAKCFPSIGVDGDLWDSQKITQKKQNQLTNCPLEDLDVLNPNLRSKS